MVDIYPLSGFHETVTDTIVKYLVRFQAVIKHYTMLHIGEHRQSSSNHHAFIRR